MDTEQETPRRRGPRIVLAVFAVILVAVVAIVVLAVATGGRVDSLADRAGSREVDETTPGETGFASHAGLALVRPDDLAALLDPALAAALDLPGVHYAGVDVTSGRDTLRVEVGARATITGSIRLPVLVQARLRSTPGPDATTIALDRVWIGRLPVPRFAVRSAAARYLEPQTVGAQVKPLGMRYDPDEIALIWDLPFTVSATAGSALPLPPGVSVTAFALAPDGVRLGLALPPSIDVGLERTAIALLDTRGDLTARLASAIGDEYRDQIEAFEEDLDEIARAMSDSAFESGAVITYAIGSVRATPGGGRAFEVAIGDRLDVGTTVETARDGEAELAFPGGHRLALRPGTTLVIDEASIAGATSGAAAPGGRTRLSVTGGRLRTVVGQLSGAESAFVVATPSAVAGVRGTDFIVSVGRDATDLSVIEGSVAAADDEAGLEDAAPVSDAQTVTFADGVPGPVRELAASDVQELLDEYAIVTSDDLLSMLTRPNAVSILAPLVTRYGGLWTTLSEAEQERVQNEFEAYLGGHPAVARAVDQLARQFDFSAFE